MKFIFKARDRQGAMKAGKIEAPDRNTAVNVLNENDLIPIFVDKEKSYPQIVRDFQKSWEGISPKELLVFFRQLSTLIGSRVPIVSALRAIQEQTENKFLKIVLTEVIDDVEEGMTFSDALYRHPDVFPEIVYNTVKAGEFSGNLQESVAFVADNTEKNYRLVSRVKGALFYPVFVIVIAGMAGFFAISYIVPKLTEVIKDTEADMPWYTEFIIFISDFMRSYWWAVLVVILSGIVGIIYYIGTESGKREWDKIKLNIPIVGKIFRSLYLSRFAGNLSMLSKGGVPVVQALGIVSSVVNNSVYRGIILRTSDEVKRGGMMSKVLMSSPYIPTIVSRMIKIGEETGKIDESLDHVAKFYEDEVDDAVKNLTSIIEPVLIIFLGIGVAILVFAILMPIYSITDKL